MSAIPSHLDPHGSPAVFQQGDASDTTLPASKPEKARWTSREWRVAVLVAMVAVVSLGDLYMTLTYLSNGGMAEGNPVARWVMSLGCPWLLAAWKMGMVLFTCTVLFVFKKRGTTEVAAWVCCIAMAWLCVQWSVYVRDVGTEMNNNPQLTQVSSWVSFDAN